MFPFYTPENTKWNMSSKLVNTFFYFTVLGCIKENVFDACFAGIHILWHHQECRKEMFFTQGSKYFFEVNNKDI